MFEYDVIHVVTGYSLNTLVNLQLETTCQTIPQQLCKSLVINNDGYQTISHFQTSQHPAEKW